MAQSLPYFEIKFAKIVNIQDILKTEDDSDNVYTPEVDLDYSDGIKEKTKHFPFSPENKNSPQDKLSNFLNERKSKTYTPSKNLSCDWTDKKRFLLHYRMLKSYLKHGVVVEKFQEVIDLKQKYCSKLIKFYCFITNKRDVTKTEVEQDLTRGMNCSVYGKTLENVENRLKIEVVEKDDDDKLVKVQSTKTLDGSKKSYDNYDTTKFLTM